MADSRQSHDADDAVLTGLARLSAALAVDPPPDQLAVDVQARIGGLPTPAARRPARRGLNALTDRLRRHWRAATAVAVALLLGILAVSPAGARIAQWLGIGGVRIVQEVPQSTGPPDPAGADGFTEVDLDQARARVSFPLAVPADLGPPTRVLIGPADTVVSMVWAGGDPRRAGRPGPAGSAGRPARSGGHQVVHRRPRVPTGGRAGRVLAAGTAPVGLHRPGRRRPPNDREPPARH